MEQKNIYWQFRNLTAIEEPVFNGVLEKFYKLGIDGLVRENIQNSLDGKLPECNKPVEVYIQTGDMKTKDIPGIEEIKERILCLKGESGYTRETIQHMKDYIHKETVQFLSFEDRNTKGLSGAENGENYKAGDTWGVYAYKKGVHHVEEDERLENMRGGSHGVGKIASNAASDLYLMFFANCDEYGNKHLGGTVQLIEHNYNGKCYRATGYFSDKDNQGYLCPFENQFDPVFAKETRGLKIIIPFLREQYFDDKQIMRSICDNFFVAILTGKLVVSLNEEIVDAETIKDIVSNTEYYTEQEAENMKNNFTPLYVNTYLNQSPFEVTIEDIRNKNHRFQLYFAYDEAIKRGRLAIVRRIGMKIEDKKIKNYATAPFNGVLIPATDEEDIFLKTLENESHTEISSSHIKKPEDQKNALRFINNISKTVGEIIAEIMKERNPADGKIDTSELFYSMETAFRKELSKSVSTVKLTKGNSKDDKTIVKIKTNTRQNKKKDKKKETKTIVDKILKRVRKKENPKTTATRVRYDMKPDTIQRVVLKGKEIIHLDFSQHEKYEGENICDISLSVVDGTGKEYDTEFNVSENYSKIVDKLADQECKIDGNIIKNVSIKESQVNLEMHTTNKFNESLKFIYYVEV